MTKVLSLLGLTVVLAIIKAVVIALAIMLLIALAYSFVTRPRGTLLFLGVLTLSGLATARPVGALVALGAIGVAVALSRRKREAPSQLLLKNGCERP